MPIPITQPKITMFNNYPANWNSHYHESGYLEIDPTIKHGLLSSLPILWTDATFASAQQLWQSARDMGLKFGWAQASRDANGTAGLLTVARTHEDITAVELNEKQARLHWLSQAAHVAISRVLAPKLSPEVDAVLSPREIEVLRWAAAGKTSGETSEILGISERTVVFHINNVLAKLNCTNKTAAAVKAVSLGMLN